MATTTSVSIPNPSLELFTDPATQVEPEMDQNDVGASPEQNRSSSLSDIGDHGDENMAEPEQALSVTESDPNDTEAETERLEDSPQKTRETQNLLLNNPSAIYDLPVDAPLPIESVERESVKETAQGPAGASSRASSMENDQGASTLNRPKKRKRSNVDFHYTNDQNSAESLPVDTLKANSLASSPGSSPPTNQLEKWSISGGSSHDEDQGSERDTQALPEALKVKAKRGKRKLGQAGEVHIGPICPTPVNFQRGLKPPPNDRAPDPNADDVEMEDSGEYGGSDNINKDEEASTKKRSAMDSLNAIERCFASLRDKLLDERLAKLDAELTMLAEPNVTHPELLGMNQVLEQRRDEKIQHENTLLKYKLGSLENKSKAEKAQVHGQYLQSVRDIRDWNLEQVNKEWYQIHKERFGRENTVPEYMYQFPTRRSQQITHQTAYNKEVSLLSGIAKYRGFPATPEICGAKSSEIESDLEKMGIVVQQPSATPARHPPSLRASLSATAALQRSKTVADEHFLEQNPWANPQHPAHLHRQASGLSRTASPLAVSTAQKRPLDSSIGMRSTPTSAETPSGPRPAANAAIGHADMETRINKQQLGVQASHHAPSSTPSKDVQAANENQAGQSSSQAARLQRNKASPLPGSERAHPSLTGRNAGQEIHVKPYMPRASFKANSPNSASALKTPGSPSNRFPNIKAEDLSRLPVRSSTPQQYRQPIQVAVNGGIDGFAAS
ncbi:MAG: hypothetical protein Q9221_003693 [Calogaya cf. arnoldii]